MPRPPRADVVGKIYHVLNRGNGRMTIVRKDADFEAFEKVLDDGLQTYSVELMVYQLMSIRWNIVLSPREDGAMRSLKGRTSIGPSPACPHAHDRSAGNGLL